MQYRTLGRSGITVSEIGFGAWGIGGGWGEQDDAKAIDALKQAFDEGITTYDSAYVYGDGHSETLIGKALGDRSDKIVITSKVPPKAMKFPPLTRDIMDHYPAEWIVECTERSLAKFGVDCIDLQQLHAWRADWLDQTEWLEALTKLRDQGKIKAFGVSAESWDPDSAVGLAKSGLVDSIQVIYNVFEQRPDEALFPAAIQSKTGIIVRVPFEEGLLTGNFRPGHEFDEGDWRARWMTPERLKEAEPHVDQVAGEVDETYTDLATLSLKFCLMHEAVSTVIPGMRRPKHVKANAAVSDLPPIPADKLERLRGMRWRHGWLYPWASTLDD